MLLFRGGMAKVESITTSYMKATWRYSKYGVQINLPPWPSCFIYYFLLFQDYDGDDGDDDDDLNDPDYVDKSDEGDSTDEDLSGTCMVFLLILIFYAMGMHACLAC